MTPKEKAKELVDKHYDKMFYLRDGYNSSDVCEAAKQCALIAVDEILSFIEDDRKEFSWKKYYQEVKQEIEKL